jgi:hypothetical protein
VEAISVSSAEVKTAALEIKTLTVAARQVTLSVFRQIQEEALIIFQDESVALAGILWGNVNYFFGTDKDCSGINFFNILWQKGSELRRCAISKNVENFSFIKSKYRNIYEREAHIERIVEDADYYRNDEWAAKWNLKKIEKLINEEQEKLSTLDSSYDNRTESDEERLAYYENSGYYTNYTTELRNKKISGNFTTKEDSIKEATTKINNEIERLSQCLVSAEYNHCNHKLGLKMMQSNVNKITEELTDLIKSFYDIPQLFIAI